MKVSPQKHQGKTCITPVFASFSFIGLSYAGNRRLIVFCKLLKESTSYVLLPSISREQLEFEALHKNKQTN